LLLGALLVAISRRVRVNPHLRETWIPVAFVGTVLMNPRILFYDTAPLTIPLLLIGWRSLLLLQKQVEQRRTGRASGSFHSAIKANHFQSPRFHQRTLTPVLVGVCGFATCNILDGIWGDWLPMELTVLLGVFTLGLWMLLRPVASISHGNLQPEMP
jgi:hypothetical protein